MKWFTLLFFVFIIVGFAQSPNWTSVKETNINVSSANSVDIFTNRDGSHIIVQEGNYLKYYKMNINGVAGSAINLESNVSVVSPSITGNDTKIYVVYRKSNESYIRTKYSTNSGVSWYYLTTYPPYSNATSIESDYSNTGLHVTYQVSNVVYYSRYNGTSWSTPVIVSTGESGINPRITARYNGQYKDSVYFIWQKYGTNEFNHRRYEVTSNTWGNKLPGYTVSVPNLVYSTLAGFRVTGTTIIIYYSYYENGTYSYHFNWAWRDINNNNLLGTGTPTLTDPQKLYSTTTFDNENHTAFYYVMIAGGEGGEQSPLAIWRAKSTDGFPDDIIYEYQDFPQYEPMFINISSAGNEVHVIWKDEFGNNNGNNLRYKFDDQAPIMPNNLHVTRSLNNHPYLTWSANPEPDFDHYIVEKAYQGGWTTLTQTTNTYFEDPNETYCTAPPPQVCDGERTVTYHVSAVDKHPYTSLPSEVKTNVTGGYPPDKAVAQISEMPGKYELEQNYPNPFNPSTSITYSLKNPEFVTLKIFDMLGREVAELVNENKPEGKYTVEFNSGDLPSGIYIYKLDAGKFSDMKKMLLIK